jgi:hypothetical protein
VPRPGRDRRDARHARRPAAAGRSYYRIEVNVIGKQYKRNSPIDNRRTRRSRSASPALRPKRTSKSMSIELKPFCHEAEVLLAEDFGLKLTINFRTIDRSKPCSARAWTSCSAS